MRPNQKHLFSLWSLVLAAALFVVPVFAAEPLPMREGLVVDFTNSESRSISLRVGEKDGITAEMNFAVLDSAGVQVAAFYPWEILTDRFWSGPLARDDFSKIAIGDTVVRISLGTEEAAGLREQFQERMVRLEELRREGRLRRLGEDRGALLDQINDIDVESVGLRNDLEDLQDELDRLNDRTRWRLDDLQERIDELRDKRLDLSEERQDLLDRRDDLLRRREPPQDRIRDLNEDIADLDRDIGSYNLEMDELRTDIRDLQEESRELENRMREVRDDQRDLDTQKGEFLKELEELDREIKALQKQ